MQNAKDTFYEVLRGRLVAVNPERTVVVRGLTRPGVLVAENELLQAATVVDCFVMRWTGLEVNTKGALPTVTMRCEIGYATAGTAMNGGMDRGRALAAMDAELAQALRQTPRSAVKTSYASGVAEAMGTRIWWGDAELGEAKVVGDRLQRTASVAVMSFEEAGDA